MRPFHGPASSPLASPTDPDPRPVRAMARVALPAAVLARPRRLLLVVVCAAIALTALGVPVTSAQGQVLYVADTTERLPADDPWAPVWDRMPGLDVALSPQIGVPPALTGPSVPTVRARALSDGERIAILLEWSDPTLDDSVLEADAFADAAAIQFAQGTGISICMGQQAGALNIWHWKADWAADLAAWRDIWDAHPNAPADATVPKPEAGTGPEPPGFLSGAMAGNLRSLPRRSSVEDLNAVGFGSLTAQPAEGQDVAGASGWRDGVWRVVFSRRLTPDDPNDAQIRRDGATVVAFAVWDGARGERDGLKSTSTWLSLAFMPRGPGLLDAWPFFVLMLMAIGAGAVLLVYASRQPAVGRGWPGGRPPGREEPSA